MGDSISSVVETPDLAVIGISAAAEVSLALVVLHVVANRRHPAYFAKNYGLILYTALAGMLFNLAIAMRYGWWGVVMDAWETPVGCSMEPWLLWSGVGGFFACSFLRVYRYHNVLVLHNGFMWPVSLQLAALMLPFLSVPVLFAVNTGVVAFDEDTLECERESEKPEAFAFGSMVVLAAATAALTLSLQDTKTQAPEEVSAAVATSFTVLLAVIVLPLLHEGLEQERDERRRAMLVASAVMTVVVVASPLVGPVKGFLLSRDGHLKARGRGDFGYDRSRQPGDLQKISQDRMKINGLASFPGGRYIPEASAMAGFFRDSLDRESIEDPFLLQASTMRILNKYVQERAPLFIPLSPSCREEILASKASSAVIFDRARQEVMMRLGGGKVAYCTSPTNTVASGDSFYAGSTSGDSDGSTGAPPEPLVVGPPVRTKWARNAAVAGRQKKRGGFGAIAGSSSELLESFGLRPSLRQGSAQSREKMNSMFAGRNKFSNVEGDGGGGNGRGRGLDPFEDSWSPRRDEVSAVEMLPELDQSGTLDDLDPFGGLQGTLDFNFTESIAAIPGLAESMTFSRKRKDSFTEARRMQKKNDSMTLSSSSSASSSEASQDISDESEPHVVTSEPHVVNPIFVGELKQAIARRQSG